MSVLGLKLDVVSAQTLCNGDLVVSLVCGRYPLLLPTLLDVLGSALHRRVTWATLPTGMTGYAMYLSPDCRGCTVMYYLPVARHMMIPTAVIFSPFL